MVKPVIPYVLQNGKVIFPMEYCLTCSPPIDSEKVKILRDKNKIMGDWAFARYCAKRHVPFDMCYVIIFNRKPRI